MECRESLIRGYIKMLPLKSPYARNYELRATTFCFDDSLCQARKTKKRFDGSLDLPSGSQNNFFVQGERIKDNGRFVTMIKKTTLNFLNDVSENNNREWFAQHKERYLAVKENVAGFGEAVFSELGKIDVLEKLTLYRIYKDVRFSKEKIPYNRHLGGRMIRATKNRRGGYYFHIEPGNTYITSGFWSPNKEDLLRIRQELAADATTFRKIIEDKKFIKYFGNLNGEQLKTAPKGFDKDHKDIDLLRYKQFVVYHRFNDNEVLAPDFVKKVTEAYQVMRPFLDYMSVVLTTDENGEEV